ncbi:L,D-transpeptidase family protein [Roseovarius sp. 2305UL8-3]|uniref:L,D-transpeptidase family protein n=1 Tax=Roseovarius conchicola TaxID=3121636 RepID=UPI003529BFB4
MNIFKFVAAVLLVVGLAGCGAKSKFQSYNGPEVTHVLIQKENRKMYLFHKDRVLKSYDVDLGFTAEGHKQFEGDGKTPEGVYRIDRRNPNSAFHLSIGISYPNEKDIAFALAHGKSPGGDIFIHGQPNGERRVGRPDWTAGCISVTNREMEEIYAMVKNETWVTIKP